MRDPLATVLRIRRITVDDARRQLGVAIRAEEQGNMALLEAEAAIGAEGEAASDLRAGDGAVEAYALWLPVGRALVAQAQFAAERARSEVALARAALAVARAAAESADSLLTRRRDAAQLEVLRREQIQTDEVAGRAKPSEG
jgi:flagellar biosynthesis chaperone FliJ